MCEKVNRIQAKQIPQGRRGGGSIRPKRLATRIIIIIMVVVFLPLLPLAVAVPGSGSATKFSVLLGQGRRDPVVVIKLIRAREEVEGYLVVFAAEKEFALRIVLMRHFPTLALLPYSWVVLLLLLIMSLITEVGVIHDRKEC